MTSFFDDLERQLLDAARERPRRLRHARLRRLSAVGATVGVLLAGGVGVAAGLGGGHDAGDPGRAGDATTATASVPPPLGQFKVAVLNGTTVPGAARRVANRLSRAGASIGIVRNALHQTVDRSRIYFRRGHQHDAALVADALGGTGGELWQADGGDSVVVLGGAEANVIVLVGADLASDSADVP